MSSRPYKAGKRDKMEPKKLNRRNKIIIGFVIAVFVLVQDMYDNGTYYVDKGQPNKTVESILNMHAVNLM